MQNVVELEFLFGGKVLRVLEKAVFCMLEEGFIVALLLELPGFIDPYVSDYSKKTGMFQSGMKSKRRSLRGS